MPSDACLSPPPIIGMLYDRYYREYQENTVSDVCVEVTEHMVLGVQGWVSSYIMSSLYTMRTQVYGQKKWIFKRVRILHVNFTTLCLRS